MLPRPPADRHRESLLPPSHSVLLFLVLRLASSFPLPPSASLLFFPRRPLPTPHTPTPSNILVSTPDIPLSFHPSPPFFLLRLRGRGIVKIWPYPRCTHPTTLSPPTGTITRHPAARVLLLLLSACCRSYHPPPPPSSTPASLQSLTLECRSLTTYFRGWLQGSSPGEWGERARGTVGIREE